MCFIISLNAQSYSYWSELCLLAAVKIVDGELHTGDTIHIKGHTSDFMQKVDSMELEHESADTAKPGDNVGIAMDEYTREHDSVYVVH